MFKTILVTTIIFIATALMPSFVHAEDQTCVTQYGGAVVCGAATPQFHTPVKTGIADVNMQLVSISFIALSGFLFFKSRKSVAR